METDFDFVVIGGGSAGYAAARTAYSLGKKVAVVDGAAELSGLCILRGCMPSKTLIYSAEILHLAQRGADFGLNIPEARVNLPALMDRKRRLIKEFADYRKQQLEDGRFALFRANARFLEPNLLQLDNGLRLKTGKALIATGSKIAWPEVPGLREYTTHTSDTVLDADTLPESMIILGGGVVACELSQYLSRIGVKITQIQRSPHILKEYTPEAASAVEHAFREERISLYTGTKLLGIEINSEQRVKVSFEHQGRTTSVEARGLMNALGRAPATDSLGLEKLGVALNKNGQIKVDAYQQSTVAGIYAAGDCTGPHEIVHVAIMQGEVAAKHASGAPVDPVDYRALTTVTFTDPQVAYCGLSAAELASRKEGIVSASYPFNDHGKSLVMSALYGHVRTWADKRTGELLAAECVGKDAGELIHAMTVAIQLRAKVQDLLKAHWYHPTLSEIWSYPLEECADALATD